MMKCLGHSPKFCWTVLQV